jgi:hypothetical protein
MEVHDNGVWFTGAIDPVWGEYKNLPYTNKPFNDDITKTQWVSRGHRYNKYTGEIIDFDGLPDWVMPIAKTTGMANVGASLYKMTPGCILPTHSDTYVMYKKVHNITHNRIRRIVVFLEDWQSGHYLEVNGNAILNWKAGQWVGWNYTCPHLAANIGDTDRYTMQVTGMYEPE